MIHPCYPTAAELDAWCERLVSHAEGIPVNVRALEAPQYTYQLGVRHSQGSHYVAFEAEGRETFFGYWQPACRGPAPILFNVPSYAAEIAAHPQFVADGFHVLHINPLGYQTPYGPSKEDRNWTVLSDTIGSAGERGYVDWLTDAAIGVLWALSREDVCSDRFAFFGVSQGGGGALLLGSLFKGRGVRAVAADLPFLTGYGLRAQQGNAGAYGLLEGVSRSQETAEGWRALGFVDTLSHAGRLTVPVLLTAGSEDRATPPDTIEALHHALPGTKQYTLLKGQGHAATVPFIHLAHSWFRLYV